MCPLWISADDCSPTKRAGQGDATAWEADKRDTTGQSGCASDPDKPLVDVSRVLEEIRVTAKRIEAGGHRRRTVASRVVLEATDQTRMDGYFDEMRGLSTLGADREGNTFSIEGLGADLGKVTLDGQGMGEARGSGGLNAGDLPPELILRADLFKTPPAAVEEGGSAGVVNLRLRNPVDLPASLVNAKGKLDYALDTATVSGSASVFTGKPSADRTFGYMLSLSYFNKPRQRNNQDIPSWSPLTVDDAEIYVPDQVRNSVSEFDEDSVLGGLLIGWRPGPSLEIGGSLLLSRQDRTVESHSLQHRLEKQRVVEILDFNERMATRLYSSDPARRNLRISGNLRGEQIDSVLSGFDFTWRGERWRVIGAAGFSIDENINEPWSRNLGHDANSSFAYDMNPGGGLMMNYPGEMPPADEFHSGRIGLVDRKIRDSNAFGGIDFIHSLHNSWFRFFRFGGKARETGRSVENATAQLHPGDCGTLACFFTGRYWQTPWERDPWPGTDLGLVNEAVQAGEIDWKQNLLNEYDVTRRSLAGYVQTDFRARMNRGGSVAGSVGARIVNTDTVIEGFRNDGQGFEPFRQKNTDSEILPSFSMLLRFSKRIELRLGAARVMTYPAFNNLAPGIRINTTDKTAKSGNPDLEPFRADQYLLEVGWTPDFGLVLSGMLIYRNVDRYFARGEESIEIDDATYVVTRPINGYGGSIQTTGVKVSQDLGHLMNTLRHLNLFASYTYNDSSTDMQDPFTGQVLPLPNTAEYVVKAGVSYARQSISGRIQYQRRGASLKSSFSESGFSIWSRPVGNLNLNLQWNVNPSLRLGLDARNLLGDDQAETTDNKRQWIRIIERGRFFSMTARVKW